MIDIPSIRAISDKVSMFDLLSTETFKDETHSGILELFKNKTCYELYYAIGKLCRPSSILEIGVRKGWSAFALTKGAEESIKKITLVDSEQDGFTLADVASKHWELVEQKLLPVVPLDIFVGTSKQFFIHRLGQVDLIHIDGDHTFDGCYHDLNASLKFCPKFILVDDFFGIESVHKACELFMGRNQDIIKHSFTLDNGSTKNDAKGLLFMELKTGQSSHG